MGERTRTLMLAVFLVLICGGIGRITQYASAQPMNYRLVNLGYLTVATHATDYPEIVVGPGDTLGGVDGALFNAFAKDHGLKLRLYQTTFASMILAVQQGKADIGEGVYYTAERAKHVYYTYPFYVTHTVIYTAKSFAYAGPQSMSGKKVGTIIGYVWAPYLQKWSASGTLLFPDEVTIAQALINGQIQGYVNGWPLFTPPFTATNVAAHALHVGDFGFPESVLANTAYNIVNCNNRGIAVALDQELTKLHTSGSWLETLKANGIGPDGDAPLKSSAQVCSQG